MDGLSKLVEMTKGSSLSDYDTKLYVSAENAARTIYLADLPRNTSYLDISEFFESRVGSCLIAIKRPLFKNFYFAFVQFPKLEDAKKVLAEYRFPVIKGSTCRAIPYNYACSFGSSNATLPNASDDPEKASCQLFVKNLPKRWTHANLYTTFEPFGPINSAKVSIDAKFVSRGYGFVEFKNQEDSLKAVKELNGKSVAKIEEKGDKAAKPSEADKSSSSSEEASNPKDCLVVAPFESRRNRLNTSEKPICPNLYVKQFPVKLNVSTTESADQTAAEDEEKTETKREDFTDDDLKNLFTPFGELVNAAVMRDSASERSKGFGFVSFKNWQDAKKALETFNKAENEATEEEKSTVLYVREAKSKEQRELEIAKKTYQFKKSMMYLNLLVRNVDPEASDSEIREFFEQWGPISNVKFNADCEMAFVSFKDRESARAAKMACPQTAFRNRYLLVSFVEPRETRQLHQEEKLDKKAFEKHQMTTLSSKNSDLISLVASLGILMGQFANSQNSVQGQHGGGAAHLLGQRRPLGQQQAPMNGQNSQYSQVPQQYGGGVQGQMSRGGGIMNGQNQQYATQNPRYRRVGNPQQRLMNNGSSYPAQNQNQNQNQQRFTAPQMPGGGQQQFANNPNTMQQVPTTQMTYQMPLNQPQMVFGSNQNSTGLLTEKAVTYAEGINKMFTSQMFLEGTQDKRREIVGTAIYHHVEELIGSEHAPKITGMIIDLQPAELNLSIQSYAGLQGKVQSAMELLVKSNMASKEQETAAAQTEQASVATQ